jgi:hypothetical protein
MKRIILFLSIILCFGQFAFSQLNAVKHANDLYAKGDYSNAAKEYEKVLNSVGIAPEIYFNLGNAYYKSNEIGKSILNYERALRLSPSFDDAKFNLELAQLKVVDNIVPSPTFFIGRWIQNLIKLLTSNQWLFISFSVFILFLALIFLFIFGPSRLIRQFSFYFAIVLVGLSFVSFIFAGVRKGQMLNHSDAIIMSGVISVKSSPDKSGTDLFQLHEGAKVTIKSTLGSWTEIKLSNGGIGWVEQVNIEKI